MLLASVVVALLLGAAPSPSPLGSLATIGST